MNVDSKHAPTSDNARRAVTGRPARIGRVANAFTAIFPRPGGPLTRLSVSGPPDESASVLPGRYVKPVDLSRQQALPTQIPPGCW